MHVHHLSVISIIRTDASKIHRMILSLSHSPDASQGLPMASHGHGRRVQHGNRAHSAPKPQGTPSWLPITSPTAASAHCPPGPTRPTDTHTGRARTAQPWPPHILTAHELQRRHHAHKLSTVDSRSGRHGKERESSCTGTSTAASRWMD